MRPSNIAIGLALCLAVGCGAGSTNPEKKDEGGRFELFVQASFSLFSLHRSLTRDILPASPNGGRNTFWLILPVLPTRSMASLYKCEPGH